MTSRSDLQRHKWPCRVTLWQFTAVHESTHSNKSPTYSWHGTCIVLGRPTGYTEMNANHINVMPEVPAFDEWDHRTQSETVIIRTVDGYWYTARWTVYQDRGVDSCWELIGREGLQLAQGDVCLWFYPSVSFAPADQQG